ncbi:tyrosine-type recombinase/integrase [Solimonas marina]|uniref:Tyrosine-type recombinase/integrase n=1 Tax=Solimonas marina TaxID=2714601 RepID=A0A970B5B9_9GAMM|nr:integrase arm-type DNA-binding domain-containing protein [Solimonas marina]NKF23242.1 tyrosine-type recombinase/integrase [Solimonas marina]
MPTNLLSPAKVDKIKPGTKPLKLNDGDGLFLLVNPNGSKWWRFRYRHDGKSKLLSLGVHPHTGLADARQRRDECRRLIAQGVDPSVHRQGTKQAAVAALSNNFEAVAREWLSKQQHLSLVTLDKSRVLLERLAFPWIGESPVSDITAPALLAVLRRVEGRGRIETAHRLKQLCGRVFRYAIATGRAERDPSADLRGALATAKVSHRAAVTEPAAFAKLLHDLDGYTGTFVVASALKVAPLLFVRPGELRRMEWPELNLEAAEWRIPASKMKMRREHVVPLPVQVIDILRELYPLTGRGPDLRLDAPRYVFPSSRSRLKPMSENTINAALRGLGYSKDQATAHGFRATASTLLHELGWPSDVIERQLAHQERNAVKRAYNRSQYLAKRQKLMQAWADHCDALKRGDRKVTALRAV